jgi:hypothetical protein
VVIARPLIDYNVLERNPEQQEIPGKFEVSFDKLVVSVGATTATFNIPGVADYALFLKEVSDAAAVRQRVLTCLEKASALLSESAVITGGSIDEKEAERLFIVQNIKAVDTAIISIDEDRTVCKSIRFLYENNKEVYDFGFANGGDQNNNSIPEVPVCQELGIQLIDGLGDKIQSSSWLLNKE